MVNIFKAGQKTTAIAGVFTILFAIAKAVVGIISGSIVLLADAIHSAADSFSTFTAWLGLKIAQKKPTQKFPYGFYKAENVAALIISGLILFAGFSIVKEGINKIFTEYQLNIPLIAIILAITDAIVMFLIGSYEIKVGRKINSQSLIADGKESRMHIFSSSVVLIGLIATIINIPYLEGIAGIVISLFIFEVGISSAKDSIFALMDVAPSKKNEQKVKRTLNKISGIRGYDNLKLRKAGPFVFGEVEAKVGKTVNVEKAGQISKIIEQEIKKKVELIDSFAVKVVPFQTKQRKFCIPIEKDQGLDSKIYDHFGRAKKFLFLEMDGKKVKNYCVKDNPYQQKEIRAGLNAASFVVKEKIDFVIITEIGPISLHTLRDNVVDVYQASSDQTINQIIKKLANNELELLKTPTRKKT